MDSRTVDDTVWDILQDQGVNNFDPSIEESSKSIESMLNFSDDSLPVAELSEKEPTEKRPFRGSLEEFAKLQAAAMGLTPTPQSPLVKKKQRMSIQMAPEMMTYPRGSEKKPVTFSTLRDVPPDPAMQPPVLDPSSELVKFPLSYMQPNAMVFSNSEISNPTFPPVVPIKTEMPSSGFQVPKTENYTVPSPLHMFPAKVEGENHFHLLEEPGARQRKSYKNENRYIVPNPLTVCLKPESMKKIPLILAANITAMLVDNNGNPIVGSPHILESADGNLTHPLVAPNFSTDFSLKVLETSNKQLYRLLFTVNCYVPGGSFQEKILSRPFEVTSNRRKLQKEKPVVNELDPPYGPFAGGNEVRITGSGFSEKVAVTFGDQAAKVKEGDSNLLVVIVPPIEDMEKRVTVVVANRYQQNESKLAEDRKSVV